MEKGENIQYNIFQYNTISIYVRGRRGAKP